MSSLFAAFMLAAVAGAAETKKPEIVDGTHGYYAENYVEVTDPLVKAEIGPATLVCHRGERSGGAQTVTPLVRAREIRSSSISKRATSVCVRTLRRSSSDSVPLTFRVPVENDS